MVKNIIETFDLTKIYTLKRGKKEVKALNNVNISVKEGEIFGLLGPNGAGKTTMIQILTTLIQPTRGYAIIDGYNILKKPLNVQKRIALMLSNKMIYNRITGYDNLKYFCKIYCVPNYKQKIFDIAKEFGLQKWLNQYVEKFSSGMKMKLALCRTFLLDRKILFLDEPSVGIDIESISFIVDKIKNSDCTIFLSSHNMNVVEKLCTRIAILNKGNILKIGTKEEIRRLEQTEVNIEIGIKNNKNNLQLELNQQEYISKILDTEEGLILTLRSRFNYKELLSILVKYEVSKIKEYDISLEDLFIKIENKIKNLEQQIEEKDEQISKNESVIAEQQKTIDELSKKIKNTVLISTDIEKFAKKTLDECLEIVKDKPLTFMEKYLELQECTRVDRHRQIVIDDETLTQVSKKGLAFCTQKYPLFLELSIQDFYDTGTQAAIRACPLLYNDPIWEYEGSDREQVLLDFIKIKLKEFIEEKGGERLKSVYDAHIRQGYLQVLPDIYNKIKQKIASLEAQTAEQNDQIAIQEATIQKQLKEIMMLAEK
ncbi:hypothetical protein LCGC14_2336470, partial [marine sediment metagenome]